MVDAPHPAAARLFMEWLLSPATSRLSEAARRLPVRADASATLGGKDVSSLKIVRLTTVEIVRDMQDVIEQWRDTFGT
jgi:ABC-type Fe3+ transport system substrate-binding protein